MNKNFPLIGRKVSSKAFASLCLTKQGSVLSVAFPYSVGGLMALLSLKSEDQTNAWWVFFTELFSKTPLIRTNEATTQTDQFAEKTI